MYRRFSFRKPEIETTQGLNPVIIAIGADSSPVPANEDDGASSEKRIRFFQVKK